MSLILFICFTPAFAPFIKGQNPQPTKFLSVSGKKDHYPSHALHSRKRGEPAIIFENILGSGTKSFDFVIPLLPKDLAWIDYNRPGVSQSEADTDIVNDADVVKRLHRSLVTKNAAPPYVPVGHSSGGLFIRCLLPFTPAK